MESNEKNKITEEDVLNEFGAIKNSSNTGLIIVIIILLLSLSGCIYMLITNKNITLKSNDECPKNESIIEEEPPKDEIKSVKIGQVIDTKVGKLIIDTKGYIYYINNDKIKFNDKEYNINKESSSIGIKDNYEIDSYNIGNKTEAYKLSLTNINNAYEIDNELNVSRILLIDVDGKITELLYTINDKNLIDLTIYKEVSNYKEIVSIAKTINQEKNNVLLIDKSGNEFIYENRQQS